MKIQLSLGLTLCALSPALFGQATIGGCPVFPANNIWNTPIDHLPVASNSATLVNTIGTGKYVHPDFSGAYWNGAQGGIPFILVNGSQTKYPVSYKYPAEADPGPYPIPLNAPIEGGSASTGDRHVIAIDTTNCVLYELYNAYPQTSSWTAYSGAIFNLLSHALRPDGWTSSDAAGLPIMPGLITYEEVAAGEIKHAIRFTAPQTRRAYVWPARHYASSLTGTQYPRMGERFRLKANFDITPFPADVQVILKAMKKYGIILADNGSSWFVTGKPDDRWNDENLHELHKVLGSNFEAVDATVLMVDPNTGEAKQNGISVTVTPSAPTLYVGGNQQFTATVTGTTNTAVTWKVDGVTGGSASRGFISTSGLYMAPTALPSPANVVVTATSVALSTASGSSTATLIPLPNITSLSPSPITTSTFTLTATGVGFRSGAVLSFNGVNLPTTYLSSTQVRASSTVSQSASSVPVVVRNSDGVASNTAYVNVSLPTPVPPPSSSGTGLDIGTPLPGNSSFSGGVYTVTGAGNDIWASADNFRFHYWPLSGDGTITARVTSQDNTNLWAKSGVMIRESLNPDAREVLAFVTPTTSGVNMQRRTTTGSSTMYSTGGSGNAPVWLRVSRAGNVFTTLRSSDGFSWTQFGPTLTIAMGQNTFVGLAVTSHAASLLGTTTFDNVTVQSSTPPSDFSIVPTPTTRTINAGVSTTFSLNIAPINGFTGTVSLSASGLPTGSTASFSPTSISTSGNSTVTVTTTGATPGGAHTLTFTGTSGGLSRSCQVTLTVNAVLPPTGTGTGLDIGAPLPGNSSVSGGVYTVTGGGNDIWASADNFRFHYWPLSGDGTITARVTSQANTNLWAKSGVMIRESLNPDAREVLAFVTPTTSGVNMQRRTTTGSSTMYSTGGSGSAPVWLRVKRTGNVFTTFRSSDGVSWTQFGPTLTIAMGQNTFVGLAVTSHAASLLGTSTFDNVTH